MARITYRKTRKGETIDIRADKGEDLRNVVAEMAKPVKPVVTAENLTEAQIRKLWSTTTDPQIADCCKAALGIGSPIWPVKQAAIEAVVEELNARGGK